MIRRRSHYESGARHLLCAHCDSVVKYNRGVSTAVSPLLFKRFTAFALNRDNTAPDVWVNPAQIAYLQSRIRTAGRDECTDGTRIYFQQEAGVLDVREPIDQVLA